MSLAQTKRMRVTLMAMSPYGASRAGCHGGCHARRVLSGTRCALSGCWRTGRPQVYWHRSREAAADHARGAGTGASVACRRNGSGRWRVFPCKWAPTYSPACGLSRLYLPHRDRECWHLPEPLLMGSLSARGHRSSSSNDLSITFIPAPRDVRAHACGGLRRCPRGRDTRPRPSEAYSGDLAAGQSSRAELGTRRDRAESVRH